ncbi:MAG: hypothetical protein IGS50_01260 [Synechococcales cyanobacterium C42_A2020_086]|jgi:hypothetical protein|nr:hypothetical protein [Synechococcales cyanobacterium M58_A2018_015]MBF2072382.1 hypothetical protein [Synechococcales cyanobacterium C42_A2020_086]
MDSDPQQLRRSAAKAFLEALDQLAVSLQLDREATSTSSVPTAHLCSGQALEEAAADIERYLQQSHPDAHSALYPDDGH